jgi:signal transduction histidine kinase
MQAHLLSSPAARSSPTLLLTSPSSTLTPDLLVRQTPPSPAPVFHHGSVADHAGLAHDAGNLLSALQLYCGLLGSPGVLRSEHSHYASELNLIYSRSSALIRRMLLQLPEQVALLSQPQSLATSPAQASTDPADVLRTLAPVLERIAAGSALTVSTPPSLHNLDVPAESLERIVVNLVRNAAEAMRTHSHCFTDAETPRIEVALTVAAGRAQLTVEDNGPGMPPAVASAFLRPAPLPRGAVRGLGHLIVHELATASKGVLSIRVRPGRGTVFCIKWPLRDDAFTSHLNDETGQTQSSVHRDRTC